MRSASALPDGSRLLVAVSGGADSTALLLGFRSLAPEFGLSLHTAHLPHGLRGAAADADLAFVRDLCARLGVP
ncbi:MAG: ATP-binding protein, partial [Candidatus Eisenbacteria bacterium]